MDYLFDACALIAFLNDEAGADTVAGLLTQKGDTTDHVFITCVQALEVYYDRIYVKGREYADTFLENLYSSTVVVLHDISRDVIREAGRFKTSYSMSLADAIVCATAKSLGATLVTKDDELSAPEQAGEFSMLWLK